MSLVAGFIFLIPNIQQLCTEIEMKIKFLPVPTAMDSTLGKILFGEAAERQGKYLINLLDIILIGWAADSFAYGYRG